MDNWTSLGLLIELVGESGPVVTSISINAVVADALTCEGWCFERSRNKNPIITFLGDSMPDSQPIINLEVDDQYVWVTNGQNGLETFSSETWKALFLCTLEVFWHEVVWFSERIRSMLSYLRWQQEIGWLQEIVFFVGDY